MIVNRQSKLLLRRVELPETRLPDLRYLCFMILQPRGEFVMAFVVLTKAKGVFGELPEDPLSFG